MRILADHQLTGEILGKPFFGKTLPPAEGGAPPPGLFQLTPPDKDPVFGAFVMALRARPGSGAGIVIKSSAQAYCAFKVSAVAYDFEKRTAAADSFEKRSVGADVLAKKPAGSSRMVEWKMPAGRGEASAHFGDQVKPGGGEGIKMQPPGSAEGIKLQPPGGAAQFPKMQPPGDAARFPKMQPPGGAETIKMQPPGAAAQFPKMQPPGDAARFPKMQPPGDAAQFPKMQAPGGTAQFPKMQSDPQRAASQPAAQHVDGAPAAIVLSQRAIPGRYCLVVVSGFADLLSALRAAGGAQLLIR